MSAPVVHLEKIVCIDHLCYARFGELKKNCLHSRSGGKKLASAQSMVEKNFLPPRNHNTPSPLGKIMVCPLVNADLGQVFCSLLPKVKNMSALSNYIFEISLALIFAHFIPAQELWRFLNILYY